MHKLFVKGIASVGDKTLSVGFDDTLREISSDAKVMTYVRVCLLHFALYLCPSKRLC